MFQFQFTFEDGIDDANNASLIPGLSPIDEAIKAASVPQQTGEPFSELDLDVLLATLPTQLTYSFVSVTSPGASDLQLARRDLFDARFQLISEDTGEDSEPGQVPSTRPDALSTHAASALRFIDDPSDLVPLVYEGGLKTWECSLDLASCLRRDGYAACALGKRVLELGCGTAVPTLCILREIFSSPAGDAETHVHMQDYNASVLQLVTTPNVLLAWYTSPAADAFRGSDPHASEAAALELYITPELLHAFKTSLRDYRLSLRFFTGSWDTFDLDRTGHYHLVLSSETIYHPNSLPGLVRVMRDACVRKDEHVCLVAAKTVYFGVGGGITEFIRCVESSPGGGHVETVWEKVTGVSRKVMRVRWT